MSEEKNLNGNSEQENRVQADGKSGEARPQYSYYQSQRQREEGQGNLGGVPPYSGKEPGKGKKPKKKTGIGKKFGTAVAVAAVFGLVTGVTFQAVNVVGDNYFGKDTDSQISKSTVLPDNIEPAVAAAAADTEDGIVKTVSTSAGDTSYSVADVAAVGMPSVVAITSVSIQEIPDYFSQYFGYGSTQEYTSAGSGSGIIVGENDDELLIATNNHVVEGATTISVCFMGSDVVSAQEETTRLASGNGDLDLENAVTGKIKGEDAANDLAVVSVKKSDIPEDTMKEIRIAQLGNSDDLVIGEQVVAIGNALGFGQSVTSGYVSALNRTVTTSDGATNNTLIQTDAAINPGNSGGALLNMRGEVIGINSAKYASNAVEGMGYAIPMSNAKPILENLMNRKTRDKVEDSEKASYLGVSVQDLTSDMISMYDLPQGIFVKSVNEGGPAEAAGIKKGDIITKLDGQSVTVKDKLVEMLTYYEAGETIPVTIYRSDNGEYQEQELQVTLGKRSESGLPDNNSTAQDSDQPQTVPDDDAVFEDGQESEEIPSIDEFFNYFR